MVATTCGLPLSQSRTSDTVAMADVANKAQFVGIDVSGLSITEWSNFSIVMSLWYTLLIAQLHVIAALKRLI